MYGSFYFELFHFPIFIFGFRFVAFGNPFFICCDMFSVETRLGGRVTRNLHFCKILVFKSIAGQSSLLTTFSNIEKKVKNTARSGVFWKVKLIIKRRN